MLLTNATMGERRSIEKFDHLDVLFPSPALTDVSQYRVLEE